MSRNLAIRPTGDNLAHALETFLAARQAVADANGDQDAVQTAARVEGEAHRQLHALVVAAAGPVPSAVMVDGTLIIASVDEYGDEPAYPILSVIEPARFTPFSTSRRAAG